MILKKNITVIIFLKFIIVLRFSWLKYSFKSQENVKNKT